MRECFNNVCLLSRPPRFTSQKPYEKRRRKTAKISLQRKKINDFLTHIFCALETNCENSEIYFLPYFSSHFSSPCARDNFLVWNGVRRTLGLWKREEKKKKAFWSSLIFGSSWYLSARLLPAFKKEANYDECLWMGFGWEWGKGQRGETDGKKNWLLGGQKKFKKYSYYSWQDFFTPHSTQSTSHSSPDPQKLIHTHLNNNLSTSFKFIVNQINFSWSLIEWKIYATL